MDKFDPPARAEQLLRDFASTGTEESLVALKVGAHTYLVRAVGEAMGEAMIDQFSSLRRARQGTEAQKEHANAVLPDLIGAIQLRVKFALYDLERGRAS